MFFVFFFYLNQAIVILNASENIDSLSINFVQI